MPDGAGELDNHNATGELFALDFRPICANILSAQSNNLP